MLIICFLFTLYSFFPKTKVPVVYKYFSKVESKPQEEDNLLFYGHIIKYSKLKYIDSIEKYFGIDIKGTKYLEDLCGQIVINSQIATRKYSIFKFSVLFMVLGQIFLVISLGL